MKIVILLCVILSLAVCVMGQNETLATSSVTTFLAASRDGCSYAANPSASRDIYMSAEERRAVITALAFTDTVTGMTIGSCVAANNTLTRTVTSNPVRVTVTSTAACATSFSLVVTATSLSGTVMNSGAGTFTVPSGSVQMNVAFSGLNTLAAGSNFGFQMHTQPPSSALPASPTSSGFFTDSKYVTMVDAGLTRFLQYGAEYATSRSLTVTTTASLTTFTTDVTFANHDGSASPSTNIAVWFKSGPADSTGTITNTISVDDGTSDSSSSSAAGVIGAVIGALGGVAGVVLLGIALLVIIVVVVIVVVLVVVIVVAAVALVVVLVMSVMKVGPFAGGSGPVSKNTQIWWDDTDYEEDEDMDDDEDDDEEDDDDDDDDDDESDIESSDF